MSTTKNETVDLILNLHSEEKKSVKGRVSSAAFYYFYGEQREKIMHSIEENYLMRMSFFFFRFAE
jgi:hypothetical protein